jgi:hypothetical protein
MADCAGQQPVSATGWRSLAATNYNCQRSEHRQNYSQQQDHLCFLSPIIILSAKFLLLKGL